MRLFKREKVLIKLQFIAHRDKLLLHAGINWYALVFALLPDQIFFLACGIDTFSAGRFF
jgi:hypothetical protein